ncbi:unnamed protein product, partial [marine sediment metagenome]
VTSALCPGYEADDLFAGYTRQHKDKQYVIVTNDEDIYQLLNHNVAMWMLRKKPILFTVEDFIDKYGIDPGQWATIKALGGCKSDNIPGLENIGEKRALQWIRREASKKIDDSIKSRVEEYLCWAEFTTLPWISTKFDLSLDPTEIDWDVFTKWGQIYNMKRFIIQYNEFREAFDFNG